MSDTLLDSLFFFCGLSFFSALCLAIMSLRKKHYLWTVYALLNLLVVTPVIVAFLPEGYAAGKLIGVILLLVYMFAFLVASSLSPAPPFVWTGLLGLTAFAAHLFLLHNLP
jgi:hypothetical protein